MAHTALYNKYRPQSFSEVVGQDAVVRVLRNQVQMNMASHAYLFSGPRGTGKTTMARIFAKAINCSQPDNGEVCGKCEACVALSAKNNLDIIEIDAASNTGVNDIRTLRENVKYMPAAGKYRVYIIDEVHMLSVNAFNALLKTLEEPPEHIVFIMATTEPHKLPVTVLSRCQKFEFTRIPTELIAQYLRKISDELNIKTDDKALYSISRAAAGGMRDALSLLDQMAAMGDNQIDGKLVSDTLGSADWLLYVALCEAIISQDMSRALKGLNTMMQKGCSASTIASDLMQMFRDLFVLQGLDSPGGIVTMDDDSAQRLKALSANASSGTLIKCLEIFSTLENDLRYAARPEIWLELAIAKACRVQKEKSYQALIERIEILEKKLQKGNVTYHNNEPIAKDEPKEEFFPVQDSDYLDRQQEPTDETDEAFEVVGESSHSVVQSENIESESKIEEPESYDEENIISSDEGELAQGRKIWSDAIDKVREKKLMRLMTPMKKATVSGYNGEVLEISFMEQDAASAKRFENKELSDVLAKIMKQSAGHHVSLSVKVDKLSDEENDFMQQVYDVFPDDIVSIE